MIPGSVSKVVEGIPVASATSITPRGGEVFRVTGSTAITTVNPPLGNMQNQVIWLIPVDGTLTIGGGGNFAGASITGLQNRAVMLTYLKSTAKWYIDNGA